MLSREYWNELDRPRPGCDGAQGPEALRSTSRRGRARRRPKKVQGDRAYDSEAHRRWLRERGITPVLARRKTPHGSGLGVHRWVIERTIAWLHQFRRLRVRYERRSDIHEAFATLALALIAFRFL